MILSDSEESQEGKTSLQSLLHSHSNKVIDFSVSCHLEVARSPKETFWLSVMAYYKSCKAKPEKLTKELVIQFTGEAGADSGALRREFFEDAIYQVNMNLLEGDDDRRMLRKDWGMESTYEVMGSLVAHSILQNGPGLQCLSPTVYDYLTSQSTYPEIADIPLSMGTHELISLIEKVQYNNGVMSCNI